MGKTGKCLICSETQQIMIPIQEVLVECDQLSVAEILQYLQFLTISDVTNSYHRTLCCMCVAKLQTCFEFKTLCGHVEQTLQRQSEHILKEEPISTSPVQWIKEEDQHMTFQENAINPTIKTEIYDQQSTYINTSYKDETCEDSQYLEACSIGETNTKIDISMVEKIESQKRRDHIIYNGFRFRRDRALVSGGMAWRCFRKDCSGRIRVMDDVVTVVRQHNHPPDPNQNAARKTYSEIRRRALTTCETPKQIVEEITAGIPLEVASILPNYLAAQRMIERQRKKYQFLTMK